jgi:hypothetical protein
VIRTHVSLPLVGLEEVGHHVIFTALLTRVFLAAITTTNTVTTVFAAAAGLSHSLLRGAALDRREVVLGGRGAFFRIACGGVCTLVACSLCTGHVLIVMHWSCIDCVSELTQIPIKFVCWSRVHWSCIDCVLGANTNLTCVLVVRCAIIIVGNKRWKVCAYTFEEVRAQ